MVACILAIVYSPFVDLPLTDTKTNHNSLQPLHALAVSPMAIADAGYAWIAVALHTTTAVTTDVVAITCAYLC